MSDLLDEIYKEQQAQIRRQQQSLRDLTLKTQRGETAGGVPAYTYALAPRAAQGGMSDGSSNIDIVWISNGLKSGESTGAGTGQLCYYDASIDDYRRVRDDAVVTV